MSASDAAGRGPRFSLVVTTLRDRERELATCLDALESQTFGDFEVILVDQGASPRVEAIARRHDRCRYVPATPVGLSAARNAGIALARGTLLAFPDDDCVLERDFLERASRHFATDPALVLVTGRALEPTGDRALNRFPAQAAPLTPWTLLTRHISITIVVARRALPSGEAPFDPRLGAGAPTPFGGSEETDLCYRLVLRGGRGAYDPGLVARHPSAPLDTIPAPKIAAYARGWGACFRKLSTLFGWPMPALFVWSLARPALGTALALLTGQRGLAAARMHVLRGRLEGWRSFDLAAADGRRAGARSRA